MTKAEILAALKHQSNADRLTIAKVALRIARSEWKSLTPEEKEKQLAMTSQLAWHLSDTAMQEITDALGIVLGIYS